jgi:hypothetical protein
MSSGIGILIDMDLGALNVLLSAAPGNEYRTLPPVIVASRISRGSETESAERKTEIEFMRQKPARRSQSSGVNLIELSRMIVSKRFLPGFQTFSR